MDNCIAHGITRTTQISRGTGSDCYSNGMIMEMDEAVIPREQFQSQLGC